MKQGRKCGRRRGLDTGRREFLAASAGLLAASVPVRADEGFVPHVLGANTAISGYGLFEAIDLLRELGFQTIEVQNLVGTPEPTPGKFPGFRFDEADDDLKSRIQAALRDFQLVTTHLPYTGLEYFSPDGERARNAVRTFEMALEATAFLGAKVGVMHPKAGPGMSLKETWPLMIRRIRRWGDMAKAAGFRLALETGYPLSVKERLYGMSQRGSFSRNQLIDHPHRSVGDPATAVTRIDLLLLPQRRDATIVRMALDQIFGDQHGCSSLWYREGYRPARPLIARADA